MPWVGICQQTPFLLQEGGKDNKCCSAKKEEVFFAFRHLNNELDCLVGVVAEESILLLVCLIPASCTEGVCLLLKSFPVRCHLVPFPGHKYRTDCKAVDPGCHWVQSHWGKKKKFSAKDLCEFLACLSFTLHAQHFGVNWEHLRLMFLHTIVLYLPTKQGWKLKQQKEDPSKLFLPLLSSRSRKSSERMTEAEGPPQWQCERTSVRKWMCHWAHQTTSQRPLNSYRK